MAKTLLIVYHSQSGTSAQLAIAACRAGQVEEGVDVRLCRAWDAGTRDLIDADGLLLVAAENSATLAGAAKDFLDRTFYPGIAARLVLPYGLILSAGNDGRGAAAQAQRIFRGYPFPPATEPLILRGELTQTAVQASSDYGQAFAAGLAMGIF